MFYGNGVVPATPAPDELTGYNTYQYVLPAGTVPVRFISFDVTEKQHAALLTWEVDNESNLTNLYEIERSIDGVRFDKIGSVLPSSAVNGRKNYQFIDHELKKLKQYGRIYYRIKQVDIDAKFVYTDIRSLMISSSKPEISIFPNPTHEQCQIKFSLQKNTTVTILITDESGRMMNRIIKAYPAGVNIFTINTEKWASGVYHVTIEYNKVVQNLSFIKSPAK